jgi:hypothetical protein
MINAQDIFQHPNSLLTQVYLKHHLNLLLNTKTERTKIPN